MRLDQLRFLCQIVDSGYSISRAAEAMRISQPAVSKQMRLLEAELTVKILLRRDGRVVGLTRAGHSILSVARRMINDAATVRRIGEEFTDDQAGHLTLATTHINARYVLLHVVHQFRQRYPRVQLRLRQGAPREVVELVASGNADIGVTSQPPEGTHGLVALPSHRMERGVIAPVGHPVLNCGKLTLKDVAAHPIITLDAAFTGGSAVLDAFAKHSMDANIVMTATDADVIKAYVELGLGIAILPQVVFDPTRDHSLGIADASHLFAPTVAVICFHPEDYLRQYAYDFIHMIAPDWDRSAVMLKTKS